MPRTNAAALDAFISAKTEIDAMLERLAALSADHFEWSPEEVNWGHCQRRRKNQPRGGAIVCHSGTLN